jgi:excisionase family DNA binding protein
MFATPAPPLTTSVRQMQRGPLAKAIERSVLQRQTILADPLLDLQTVRAALGNCSYSYIRKLIADGVLQTFRIGARGHHRVRQSTLEALLKKGDQHG